MASYTLTTTDQQESLLEWVVAQYNKEHETTLDAAGYIALRFPELLSAYVQPYQDALTTSLTSKFSSATADVQGQVAALLGGLP